MPFENLLNISVKKDWVDYLSALLTPTVAVFGLYIAYRQRSIEEARLRHELFEIRYKKIKMVEDFARPILKYNEEADQNFLSEICTMKYIFDQEIASYVRENIWNLACKIDTIKKMPEQENSQEQLLETRTKLRENVSVFHQKTLIYMQIDQTLSAKELFKKLATLFEKIKNAAD